MEYVYGICAIIGGTVVVWQFVMTLVGIGHGDLDGGDMHDFGGLDTDIGDLHADVGHDITDVHAGDPHSVSDGHSTAHHSSTWFFAVISFRTLIAAMAFFGLTGLAMQSDSSNSPAIIFGASLAAGLSAMFGVHWLMRWIASLRAEGTVRISHAVGLAGIVYLRIPAHKQGMGKIHLKLQNRTVELQALTEGDALPTGATIVVISVVSSDTVQVAPVQQPAQVTHA